MHLFHILSDEGAWPLELNNTWCLAEYGNAWSGSIDSQLECQDICLDNQSCVGISYSYKAGMNNICFVCTTVPPNGFHRNSLGFAFYRAPGKLFSCPILFHHLSVFVEIFPKAEMVSFGCYYHSVQNLANIVSYFIKL